MAAAIAERSFIDAWVRSDAATANFGSVTTLQVLGGGGANRVAYLQTAVPCPAGAVVVSAKLRLTQYGAASNGNRTLSLHNVLATWAESTLKWRGRPGRASTASASATVNGAGSSGRVVEFDVKADVQAWVDGAPNYGWTLESSAAQLIRFYSKNASTAGPQLVVEWTMPPERPTDVQPAGGLFSATRTPPIRWSYADRGSQIQPLARVRCQVSTSNTGWSVAAGYSAPTFDSGPLTSTTPQIDLAGTSYAGPSAGEAVWYTVQQQDASGVWSEWSDPQAYGYQPPATVTITGPAALRDTAFTVTWQTPLQERYQALLLDADTGAVLWEGLQTASTTERWAAIPRGIIRTLGRRVVVVVRVWDGFDRVAVPGVATYGEASRTLTYSDTTDVAPVTQLTASESSDNPATRLAWRRTAPAVQFGIWVDGMQMLVGDAADMSTGTSTYAQEIALPAGPDRKIVVKAIETVAVDGVEQTHASANSPTLTYERTLFGVWLVVPGEPDRNIRFLQEGEEIVETSMPEVAARFDPVGSSVSVHVTSVLRWFEGSVTDGVLADYGDLTATELRARMLLAKGDRLRTYTLMWGTHAVPVHISNVDVAGDWIPGAPRFLVSFDFTAAVPSPEYELQ